MSRYDKPHPEKVGAAMGFAEAMTLAEVELDFAEHLADVSRRREVAADEVRAAGAMWGSPLPDLAQELSEWTEYKKVFGSGKWVGEIVTPDE